MFKLMISIYKLINFNEKSSFSSNFTGKAGWQGDDCSSVDQQVYQCLPGCSERGTYDLETGTCICERHWTGPDCSQGMSNNKQFF